MDKKDIIFEQKLENRSRLEYEPEVYRILKTQKTNSGIMVVGKYGKKWMFNPPVRALIARLLEMLKIKTKKEKAMEAVLKEVNEFLQDGPYNKINKGHYVHKKIKEVLKKCQ
ncbi:hypothetical protein KAH94_05860 [bacterium]|nr:hypothetical protein [bacterium]